MDSKNVYTIKDSNSRQLRGDSNLRLQVTEPREELHYCSPLALLTNGGFFTRHFVCY